MTMISLIALTVAATFVPSARAHSWASCTKCSTTTANTCGTCLGYARNWFTQPSNPFSQDQGWDRRPGADVPAGLFCDNTKQRAHADPADGYTTTYPMAVYSPGETVRIQWPAKNHAQVGTQRGVQIFFGRAAGAGDDFSHITSKDAWITANPGLERTFSNCRDPPGGTVVGPGVDGAECIGDFVIPSTLQSGIYSVIWWWEFNAGEFYSSCYDVLVTDGGGGGGAISNPGTGDENDECNPANLPADSCSVSELSIGIDGLAIKDAPSTIPGTGSFTLTIGYNAQENQQIVVDILDTNGNFYGGGLGSSVAVNAGSGEISYPVTISTTMTNGQAGIYLKAWNVRSTQWSDNVADEPWTNELTRVDYTVSVGDAVVQCTPIPSQCLAALAGTFTDVEENPGALAGIIICFIVLVVVLYFVATNERVSSAMLSFFVGSDKVAHLLTRVLECFLALCTFALWASDDETGADGCNCESEGALLISAGVLAWLFTLAAVVIIACTAFGLFDLSSVTPAFDRFSPFVDMVLAILCAVGTLAAGYKHPETSNAQGAIACIFFLTIFLTLHSAVVLLTKALRGDSGADKTVSKKKRPLSTRHGNQDAGDQC